MQGAVGSEVARKARQWWQCTECQRSFLSKVKDQRTFGLCLYSLMNFLKEMNAPSFESCSFLTYTNHGSPFCGETMSRSIGPSKSRRWAAPCDAFLASLMDFMYDISHAENLQTLGHRRGAHDRT